MSDAFDFAAKILQTGAGTDREKFLARAVIRLTNETTELKETLDYAAVDIAELKDKLRWRKQSDDPAPAGELLIIRYQDYDEIKMRIACMEDMLDPDGEPCYADTCWRPLDLPEEEKQCRV